MDNNKKRQETVEKIGEQPRRRSLFENSTQPTDETKNTEYMKEWDEIWGSHNVDHVNVIEYPEGYKEKIKGEIDVWLKGIKVIMERAEEVASEIEYDIILEACEFSEDQKAILQDIDVQINKILEHIKEDLRSIEVHKHLKEVQRKKILRDIEFVEKLVGLKKNNV